LAATAAFLGMAGFCLTSIIKIYDYLAPPMGFLKDFWSGTTAWQNPNQAARSTTAPSSPPPIPQATSPSERAAAKFEEGLNLCDAGRTREGMAAFLAATEIDPNCIDAWFALGKCFHGINPEKYANDILSCGEGALRADPNNIKAKNLAAAGCFEKGKAAWAAEDWEAAYDCYRRSYELNPENPDALDLYCVCAGKVEKYSEFTDRLREDLKHASEGNRARPILGRVLVKMSLRDPFKADRQLQAQLLCEAESQLTTFLRTNPLDAGANYWLGAAYYMTGRVEEARQVVIKLADVDLERSRDLQELVG
jgi:tetratricopeptide (TPR) repeat protein